MADPTNPQTGAPPPSRDRRRDARLVIIGVVSALLIWFALVNTQDVTIHFWVSSSHAPLIVVIVIAAVLGAAAGALLSWTRRRRRSDQSQP